MADDLSQYGTVTAGSPPATGADLSQYGAIQEAPGPGQRFWDSLKSSLPHPIDALQEWWNKPQEYGKAMDALHVLTDLDKRASKLPENQGKPRNKWVVPKPTPDQQAVIDSGMTANIGDPMPQPGQAFTAPGERASVQAARGDLAGAAGTITGGYVAPAAVAAAVPEIPSVASKAKSIAVPIAKGAAAAVSDIPIFPKTVGAFTRPFKSGARAFSAARDAQAADEVAALPSAPAVASPAVATDPALDAIAQRLGAKDYASGGKALRELADQIKQGQDAAQAARAVQPVPQSPAPAAVPAVEAQPATPPPTVQLGGGGPLRPPLASPEPTDIGIHGGVESTPIPAGPELTDKLNNLLRQARTDAGADPDLRLGHEKGAVYQNRFGSGDSPVIDSSKRRLNSTAEIANPGKILTKKAFRDSLPANSPLLKADAFEKAYKLAVQLKSQGVPISQ